MNGAPDPSTSFENLTPWSPPEHPNVTAAKLIAAALDRQTKAISTGLRDVANAGYDLANATNSAKANGRPR